MDLYNGRNSDFSSCFCAINETQIEVKFGKALDAEQIDFIEEAGNRIVVFDSSETAKTANFVSFGFPSQ